MFVPGRPFQNLSGPCEVFVVVDPVVVVVDGLVRPSVGVKSLKWTKKNLFLKDPFSFEINSGEQNIFPSNDQTRKGEIVLREAKIGLQKTLQEKTPKHHFHGFTRRLVI